VVEGFEHIRSGRQVVAVENEADKYLKLLDLTNEVMLDDSSLDTSTSKLFPLNVILPKSSTG
jgi:hypothetical protein